MRQTTAISRRPTIAGCVTNSRQKANDGQGHQKANDGQGQQLQSSLTLRLSGSLVALAAMLSGPACSSNASDPPAGETNPSSTSPTASTTGATTPNLPTTPGASTTPGAPAPTPSTPTPDPSAGGDPTQPAPVDSAGGTGGAPSQPTSMILFSEDFESGTTLDPAAWSPSIVGGNEQGISIDTAQGNNSAASLHVAHTGFHTMASLISPDVIPLPNNSGYVRVWIRIGSMIPSAHATFVEAGSTMNDDNEVRVGVNLNVIDVNYWPGDWEQRTESLNWTPDEWHCLEFFLDGQNHEMRVWYDDVEQPSLHVTDWTGMPGNHTTPESDWMPTIESIRFGGELQSVDIWFDDIVVATDKIGCQ